MASYYHMKFKIWALLLSHMLGLLLLLSCCVPVTAAPAPSPSLSPPPSRPTSTSPSPSRSAPSPSGKTSLPPSPARSTSTSPSPSHSAPPSTSPLPLTSTSTSPSSSPPTSPSSSPSPSLSPSPSRSTSASSSPPLSSPPTNSSSNNLPPACSNLFTVDNLLFGAPPPAVQECASALYGRMSPSIDAYTFQIAKQFSACVVDPIRDRNAAFDFSSNLTFLENCLMETQGDYLDRICGLAEITVYIQELVALSASKSSGIPASPIATINCNNNKWTEGCEDGWACIFSNTLNNANASERVFQEPNFLPERVLNPRPCCEGFFCPRGLTCMIPCPLGAFCPKATYNKETGVCDPYGYQVSPGRGFECGGANMWADVGRTSGIFCPAGFFCPATTTSTSCDSGHFCRQGSTSQSKCFQLTSCNAEASTQNIKTYGVMIIVVLATLLLIVYNCFDQVMHILEKRKTKTREAAARQVREQLNAVERWKMALEAAKRLSRSFSRGHSRKLEEMQVLAPPSMARSNEAAPLRPSSRNTVATIEEDNSYYGLATPARPVAEISRSHNLDRAPEEDLYEPVEAPPMAFPQGSDKRHVASSKPQFPHTRSQIFKYAYGQIEKEKALQNKRMSLTDVVSQALQPGDHERLKLEIAFENLSMTLKGSGKKILSNVTGNLLPGRVTAVMGPSGAGKTTFLNALAGKAYNCTTTGLVLINGKAESIQSYKKIIGFVPQDDIVHGNLTVEENLWFSANYRLPISMPKAEKVLVVERIIEALGLQPIRTSKVGTVEKRGISGGQRKRVNVGIEMVMEPSLLILDEPTSGLDSTSSQLVLKALRREAYVGVNVGVVLHQPSYGLFRMFDDVMLLAKGGRTVYLGPVDEVEKYFASLNILVPDRINPPDHFMDVLEGIAKPEGNSHFDPNVLPIAWMRYKGYEIPQNLKTTVVQIDVSPARMKLKRGMDHDSSRPVENKKSFAEELWEEFRCYVEVHWHEFKSTLSTVEDLSKRKTPGFFTQFRLIFKRVAMQRFREARLQAQDYIILLLAGACLGILSNVKDSNLGSGGYPFTIIALSLLCMIAALRTFALDKLQYWRECASSINKVAYFLAKDTVDHFNTVIKPLVYLSMFYFFNDPRSTFVENYIVTLALVYCVVGLSYIFAITMDNVPAQLWSVFLPIVSTLVATRGNPSGIVKIISYFTYARWAQEAYVIANAWRYSGVWLITRCAVLEAGGYRLDHWILCICILLGYGVVARAIALFCLIFSNRSRQR